MIKIALNAQFIKQKGWGGQEIPEYERIKIEMED